MPRWWVLGAGLLLICLASSLGVALGSWRQHPLAGILAVLVLGLIEIDLVLSWANPIHLPGGTAWLFPWSAPGSLLNVLPGLTVPYPPPVHVAELAGLIVSRCRRVALAGARPPPRCGNAGRRRGSCYLLERMAGGEAGVGEGT